MTLGVSSLASDVASEVQNVSSTSYTGSVLMDASILIFRYGSHKDEIYFHKPRLQDGSIVHRRGYKYARSFARSIAWLARSCLLTRPLASK